MAQSRSENTRAKVLDAATALIMERGIAEVTLKDIQQASGVSNGSIFHHFGSKDGIIAEIFARERLDYMGHVARAITSWEGEDPCDAFGAGAKAALEWQCQHPERFSRLIAAFTDSDWLRDHGEIWLKLAAQIENPVIEWATPHFHTGKLPLIPSTLFQSAMMGGSERLTNAWLIGRLDRPSVEYADEFAEMISAGLKALRERQKVGA